MKLTGYVVSLLTYIDTLAHVIGQVQQLVLSVCVCTSPRSSVQQWLDVLDTQAPPMPTPAIPASQPVSVYSGVTTSMPLGYSASQMAAQQVRSSRHSQMSRRSRFSTTSATVIQGVVDFSSKVTDSLAHLAEGTRMDAAHREDFMRHESLAHEQCHRVQ